MPNPNASPWWWPLTRWWGLCGVVMFIGLAMLLIEAAGEWYAEETAPSIESQAPQAPAERTERPTWTASGRRVIP